MKAFVVDNKTPDVFLAEVKQGLVGKPLGEIASMRREGSEVIVTFQKLGTSEVRYRVLERDGGFRCERGAEKIALAHRPLRGEVEKALRSVLERLGARVEG